MKNSPKFDIKVSFTGQSVKANKTNLHNYLLERLLNKKINIHLKINLDKLEYQYKKEKLLQKNKIKSEYEERINIKDLIDEESQDILEEKTYKNIRLKQSPTMSVNIKHINKNSRSFSGQKMKNYINKNILVLDLDETLVYVTDTKDNYSVLPQIQFDYYAFDESEQYIRENIGKLGINKVKKSVAFLIARPGLNIFLNLLKKFYDKIVVFTSSQYSYAEEIIKIIDKKNVISKIYSRKDCSFFDDIFYKDLNKINEDLSHTIIIDNYPECYLLQHFNGLPIPSFTGNPKDNELMKLIPLLQRLSKVKDVRNYIRQIILYNEQSINYNRAYQLLDIKRENFFQPINRNLMRNKNKKNNYKSNENSNINIRVNKKNFKTYNCLLNLPANNSVKIVEEQILKNDPNDYYYIEKGNSQKEIGNENYPKISNNSISSNYTNSHFRSIKVKKNIVTNRLNHSKNLRKEKNFKLLKPQIIKSVTLNNSKNNIKNNVFEDSTLIIEKSKNYYGNLREIQNFSGKSINSSLNNTENDFINKRQKHSSINAYINNNISNNKPINLDKSNIIDNKKLNKFKKIPSSLTNSGKEIKNININNISKKSVNGKANFASSNSSEKNEINNFLSQRLVNNTLDILENNNTKVKIKKYEKNHKNSLRQLVLFHYQNGHLSP